MEGGKEGADGGWSIMALSTLSFLAQLMEPDVFTPDGYN